MWKLDSALALKPRTQTELLAEVHLKSRLDRVDKQTDASHQGVAGHLTGDVMLVGSDKGHVTRQCLS